MKIAAMKVYGTRDADAFCFPSSPPDDGSDVKPDRILKKVYLEIKEEVEKQSNKTK